MFRGGRACTRGLCLGAGAGLATPSFQRQGALKFLWSILLLTGIFLVIYITVDSAGIYSLGFRTLKFVFSLLASTAVSMPVAYLLLDNSDEQWK